MPYFEDVSLSGPETATVEDMVALEISAKNTGQRSGDFANTLQWGHDSTHIRIEDIPPRKEKTVNIEATTALYSGKYNFRITDYGTRHSVGVQPLDLDIGETYEPSTDDRLYITVDSINREGSVGYEKGGSVEQWLSDRGDVFVIVQCTIHNQTSSEQNLSTNFRIGSESSVDLSAAPVYVNSFSDLLIHQEPIAEQRKIEPGASFSGWELFKVPLDITQGSTEVEYHNAATGKADVIWSSEST